MAGLLDVVARSQPAFFAGGVNAAATVGMDWSWTFTDVVDDDGAPISLSSGTHVCRVERDGALVLSLTVTGGVGEFTVSKDEADTLAIAPGRYQWLLVLDDGTNRVTVWGPGNSDFEVRAGVGV